MYNAHTVEGIAHATYYITYGLQMNILLIVGTSKYVAGLCKLGEFKTWVMQSVDPINVRNYKSLVKENSNCDS